MARFSPIACSLVESWRFKPSPKASNRRIVTVPQAIAAIVSVARFFWSLAEPRKRCATTETSWRVIGGLQLHRHDRVEPRGVPRREVAGGEPRRSEDEGGQKGDRERDLGIADVLGGAELR